MVVIPPLSGVIQPLEPLYRVTMQNLPIYRGEIRGRRGEAAGTEAGAPPIAFHVACVPAAGEAAGPPSAARHSYLEGRRPRRLVTTHDKRRGQGHSRIAGSNRFIPATT